MIDVFYSYPTNPGIYFVARPVMGGAFALLALGLHMHA